MCGEGVGDERRESKVWMPALRWGVGRMHVSGKFVSIWAHVDLTSSGLALWPHSPESAISTEPCSRLFQTSKVPEDPIHAHWDFREVSLPRAGESREPKLDGGTPHRPCSTGV